MRAVIYTRISKDRQGEGLGVERQHQDCVRLAESLGWTVVETFSDNDISAFSGKTRPAYDAMLATLEADRAQAVITWHTDRLHRRPMELEGFIELCERKRIDVRTVKAGTLDLSNSAGRMVARMLGAAARNEVERMIERAKSAKRQAALDGRYRGGRRPFGYESDGLRLCEPEAEAVRTGAERVLRGVSLGQVAREWNAAGLRTSLGGKHFDSRQVRKVLLRPRNAGFSLHEGHRVGRGQWTPIFDADTFAALEALLQDPSRGHRKGTERKYQGSGVYLCGKCGEPMSSASQNGSAAKGGWQKTYACGRSRHLSRLIEPVDEYVSEHVIARLAAPDAHRVILGAEADVSTLHAQREGLRSRLDQLSAMFAEGAIDGSQLKRGTADLQTKLSAIDAELAAARSSSAVAWILAEDDVRAAWNSAAPDLRGKVIETLMTVTILPIGRGRRPGGSYFDPAKVKIDWKHGTS
ncbi:recombinase family protein [Mycobacteroides abscessus]|uniref:recombinase family protein n=1 Tax=Mycobacteroides abscessus TaxID=36809 RepID=UPI0009A9125C|nr:recombinase family protein [Mycobacteroides abscessus]